MLQIYLMLFDVFVMYNKPSCTLTIVSVEYLNMYVVFNVF